jgi:ThiF family/Prokaryotic homologs of the JAB domain
MRTTLTLTAAQHEILESRLLPGDGLEAVALALCGRHAGPKTHRLLVREIHPSPYDACTRAANRVVWPTSLLKPLLEQARREGLAILKIHSHPGGYPRFSGLDDAADAALFPSVHAWIDGEHPHASAVLLPDGRVFGRAHYANGEVAALDQITVIGDELRVFRALSPALSTIDLADLPEFALRYAQAFGRGTFEALRTMTVVVVGCSGTGSVVIDALARLGIGHLILIDPDRVEEKNLNRILNAFPSDIGRLKVEVQRDFVERLGFGTAIEIFAKDIADPAAIAAAASADVVFGCMDGIAGRHVLNRLATFYLIPYFDVGVRLDADGLGGVDQICGSVHYLQPGRSSLMTRRVYTAEQLRAAAMKRHDPAEYARQLTEKYIKGVAEDRPAVNGVNMLYSAMAIMDLLARVHPYRIAGNASFSGQTISLTGGFWRQLEEGPIDEALARHLGRGDMTPLLGMPFLDRSTLAA